MLLKVNGVAYFPSEIASAAAILRLTGHDVLADTLLFHSEQYDPNEEVSEMMKKKDDTECRIHDENYHVYFDNEINWGDGDEMPGFCPDEDLGECDGQVGIFDEDSVEIDVEIYNSAGDDENESQ